jgi:hypothetical protein
MSFSDLEGKLSRHPRRFNRYCRNVADRGLTARLLLRHCVQAKEKSHGTSGEPAS